MTLAGTLNVPTFTGEIKIQIASGSSIVLLGGMVQAKRGWVYT